MLIYCFHQCFLLFFRKIKHINYPPNKLKFYLFSLTIIQRPLLFVPSLAIMCISCNSFISFCTCFLVKSNSFIISTCVIVEFTFISFKISFFLSAPFIGSFSAPFWLLFGSFSSSLVFIVCFSQIQAINESCQDYNFPLQQALASLHSPKPDKYLEYHYRLFHQYQSY